MRKTECKGSDFSLQYYVQTGFVAEQTYPYRHWYLFPREKSGHWFQPPSVAVNGSHLQASEGMVLRTGINVTISHSNDDHKAIILIKHKWHEDIL
jgi:hypothetical protein